MSSRIHWHQRLKVQLIGYPTLFWIC
uniref:Uncharacterized protein n=1 Tax=Arundo donax TaxID=35708 RepID=A0A0A9HWF7_ARUDO